MRIGQTSAVSFTSQVSASAIGFAATLYLARVLGPDVLGVYFLAVAVLIWLRIAGGVGIEMAIKKRLSERGDYGPFLTASAAMLLFTFLLITAIFLLFRGHLSWYLHGVDPLVLIPILFTAIFLTYVKAVLDGQHLVHVSSLLDPTDRIVRSVIQIGAVALGFTIAGLLFGYAAGMLLAALVGLWFVSGRPAIPRREHFADLFGFAKYSWLSSLSGRAFTSMDTLVLGVFVAPGLIGIYEISWNLASILAVFGTSIVRALFPEMSRLSSEGRLEEVSELVADGLRYTGLFLFPGLVGAALVGDRVLRIYGAEFVQGHQILVLLVGARLVHIYAAPFVNALIAIDRPDIAFRVDGTFIVTNVGLNFLLVYLYGWFGAAVATGISAIVTLFIAYRALGGLAPVTIPLGDIGLQLLAAGTMGVAIIVGEGVLPSGLPATLVLIAGGALTYFVTLLGISPLFRTTVRENLPISF